MTTQTVTKSEQVQKVRELYADGPQYAKTALENSLAELTSPQGSKPRSRMESAGRIGSRQGKVSELLFITPFAPGGAARLRALLQLRDGNFDDTDRVSVHDMRFVFLDNDTKLLFATAYDGEWDPYIDDFATKITDQMDVLFSPCEGWPGIRNTQQVKDWIAKHQIAAEGWYVAHPDLAVRDIHRLKRVGKAVEEFLDKIG
jgi:hypothetical protein